MNLIYKGKTKDVYGLENGNVLLKFKDDATGENGVFNPGANQVSLKIDQMGYYNLLVTKYFFDMIEKNNIKTHFISLDEGKNEMEVVNCKPFGKGLEVIFRNYAYGSFVKRYGLYAKPMMPLKDYVEFTLKDDERNDPLITREALISFGILDDKEYEKLVEDTIEISNLISDVLAAKNIDLIDIKLEFGRDKNGNILLMDEIAAGNMRAFKDSKQLEPIELSKLILA